MIKINDLKKWNYRDGEWYDENNQIVKVVWSEKDGRFNVEHSINENIEKTIIDGIEYTKLRYVYGEGLVITDITGRYTLKVSDLSNTTSSKEDETKIVEKSNNNSDIKVNPKNTSIIKNEIHSIHHFDDNSIIALNNQKYKVKLKNYKNLSDEEIEIRYGSFATDDEILRELYSTNYIYDFEKIN